MHTQTRLYMFFEMVIIHLWRVYRLLGSPSLFLSVSFTHPIPFSFSLPPIVCPYLLKLSIKQITSCLDNNHSLYVLEQKKNKDKRSSWRGKQEVFLNKVSWDMNLLTFFKRYKSNDFLSANFFRWDMFLGAELLFVDSFPSVRRYVWKRKVQQVCWKK